MAILVLIFQMERTMMLLYQNMVKGNTEEMLAWFQEGDLFVEDHGFRDSIDFLESIGFRSRLPEYLSKGQKQNSTEEVIHSKFVTKKRWVVESANGIIKMESHGSGDTQQSASLCWRSCSDCMCNS